MADSTTKASDGTVNISIEKYEDLLRRANEQKTTINKTVLEKTPEISAQEQVVVGNLFIMGGVFWTAAGVYMRLKGLSALKSMKS